MTAILSGSVIGRSMQANIDMIGGINIDAAKGSYSSLSVHTGGDTLNSATHLSSAFAGEASTIIQALNKCLANASAGTSDGAVNVVQLSNGSSGFTSDSGFKYASDVLEVEGDITAAGASVISAAAGNITLSSAAAKVVVDAETDIDLDAKGNDINFLNNGTSRGSLDLTNAGDLGFKDSAGTEIFRIDGSANSLLMASTNKIEFTDNGEYIHSDTANDLMVNATTNLNLAIGGTDVATVTSTGIASTGIVSGVTSTFTGTGSFSHVTATKDISAGESVSGASILGTTFAGTTATFTGTGSFSHVSATKDISAGESVSGVNILGTTFAGTTATFTGTGSFSHVTATKDIIAQESVQGASIVGTNITATATGSFSHVTATKDIVAQESVSGANIFGTTFAGTTATFTGTGSFSHVTATKDIVAQESVSGASILGTTFAGTTATFTGTGSFSHVAASKDITATESVIGARLTDGAFSVASGAVTGVTTLAVSNLASLNGGIAVQTNKFTVSTAGLVAARGNVVINDGSSDTSSGLTQAQFNALPKLQIQGTTAAGVVDSFELMVSGGILRAVAV